MIERHWPRPNRLSRSAQTASHELKKLIRRKIIKVVVMIRRRETAVATNTDQRKIFLPVNFFKIVTDKLYVSAYHSNRLFMKNSKMIMNNIFS